jgi:hypothetical protein
MTINEDLNPYTLSKKDIVFKGQKVSFSRTAGQEIQSRIRQKKELNQTTIGQSCDLSQPSISHALLGNNLRKQALANIIMALMEHKVIQLPEDQHLGQLLFPEAESSCTPTSKTLNTKQNCVAVGGWGEIQASQLFLQPSPQQR